MLIVAGHFDDNGGKPSGYAKKLFTPLHSDALKNSCLPRSATFINGGNWSQLEELDFSLYKIIIWMADVPNDKPKLIRKIKEQNPHCLLISSKNNLAGKYQPLDLISRALETRSSLLLEFTHGPDKEQWFAFRLWDPLGNVYYNGIDISRLRTALFNRMFELLMTKRVASLPEFPSIGVPDEKEFFKIASDYAEKLHDLTHAVNQSRFVGNLSFRCQNGFPSFRGSDKVIYVSKRNIDKREINQQSFVPVALYANDPVEYYGDHKPSVDTPIQVLLYQTFPKIQYMIHTHAYIKGAPLSPHVLPCGDVREAEAVRLLVDHPHEKNVAFFQVNLRGHGSLVAAQELQYLRDIQYEARPLPEMVE